MSTGIQPCDEVIPGYVLTERIGSGGYAEVWRAEAPGGIDKAVKIVYGYCDDEFASQELKALERIKGVRHPFLLSLERFEVVDGRLAILTELADQSLEQRLRECRAEGLTGIPRDELLRYIADAAEAIDYLTQRHGLQHLDIKPENLLILGDHVKLADFGLVKELTSKTQNSLVAGLTPSYASPEMFDDAPSEQSDQYSLAIVYQEMLVGSLPFPGRTAAQLAKQHTQAEPQLQALPAHDRAIVARALAKNPADRYPLCTVFAKDLLHSADVARAPAAPEAASVSRVPATQPAVPLPDDMERATICKTQQRSPEPAHPEITQPVQRPNSKPTADPPPPSAVEPELLVVEETVDVPVPEFSAEPHAPQPTLFVALGGAGTQVLCRLRNLLTRRDTTEGIVDGIETIALDTDRDDLRDASSPHWKHPLVAEDTLHLPLRLPKNYSDSRDNLAWVSRRWLYNIPRSLETRGYRPLGRVALVDHARHVLSLLDARLEQLVTAAKEAEDNAGQQKPTVRVVVLSGTGGGTGAGMAIDVANAARHVALARGAEVEVQGLFLCTIFGNANLSTLAAANTYSLLTELRHASESGNRGLLSQQQEAHPFETSRPPFDSVYCVPVRTRRSSGAQPNDDLDGVARYLALETTTSVGGMIRSCRQSRTPRESPSAENLSLRKFGLTSFAEIRKHLLHGVASDFAAAVKRYWLETESTGDQAKSTRAASESAVESKSHQSDGAGARTDATANPAITPKSILPRFNDYASSRFACEVLAYVQDQSDSRTNRHGTKFSGREAALFVDAAVEALDALVERVSQDTKGAGRVEHQAVLAELVADESPRILQRVMICLDPTESDHRRRAGVVDGLVFAQCLAVLQEQLTRRDSNESLAALLQTDGDMSKAIDRTSADLLQCGSDRRTLLIVPSNRANTVDADELLAERPEAAVVTADVGEAVLLCEESGISPQSLARGLARVYPGIGDAAQRLFTRVDIEWKPLL